jgi:hypothetical protein
MRAGSCCWCCWGSGRTERERRFAFRKDQVSTVPMTTPPPMAPATASTSTFPPPPSCGLGLAAAEVTARDKTTEGGLGHKFEGMLWATQALTVAAEKRESTKDGFWEKAAPISARTACSAVEEDEGRVERDTSTETSMLIWETVWRAR